MTLADWDLDRLRGEFPLFAIGPDGDGFTAVSHDGKMSVSGRTVAELRGLLRSEWWRPFMEGQPYAEPGAT